jgi:hypothetical protein
VRTSVSIVISLTILSIFSFAFLARYAESQHGYRNIWVDIGWWFDKLIAAVAIIIAIVVFIFEERRTRRKEDKDRRDRIRRSCDTLLREIQENRDHLIRGEDRYFYYSYVKSKSTIDYPNTIFGLYAFQSVIHSGLLTYFSRDDQAILTKLYSRFDVYNENLRYLTHISTEFSSFGRSENVVNYRREIEMYELFLTGIGEDIRQLSPVVELSLETIRQNNVTDGLNSRM